jgi:hypothetical protein
LTLEPPLVMRSAAFPAIIMVAALVCAADHRRHHRCVDHAQAIHAADPQARIEPIASAVSSGPASSRSTRTDGSAERRLASTQPALPAPR